MAEKATDNRKIKRHRYHDRSEQPSRHALQCVFGDTTNRIGFHSGENSLPIALPGEMKAAKQGYIYRPGLAALIFGVIMPLAAVTIETNSHLMARNFFDPFPTHFHVLIFLLIPVSNFLSWLAVRRNITPLYSTMSLCSGMALGIAILYSVMLIPQTQMFFGQLGSGTGFLGLAPLFSIPITLLCGGTICKLADREKTFFDAHQLKHLGHLIVLVMVIMVELPSTMTRYYLGQANESRNPAQAIQWLRQWGSPEVLLRACYERSGEATDILGSLAENMHPVPVERARQIYYKVTGVAFNSVPIPASFRGTIKNSGAVSDPTGLNEAVDDEFDLDPDIAGELVSGVARGLSVSESSLDGTLDAANGVGILDWSFTFENVSTVPREARAKVLLPPNAVITKATIVLDGVEKETVIQERGIARNTYIATLYNHRKDPLLVSMAGQDSVLVQCYPVRKGSTTKIKLHIVSPLVVSGKGEESLPLPTFEERNFAISKPHRLSLTGDSKMTVTGISGTEEIAGDKHLLTASLENSLLSRFSAVAKIAAGTDSASEELAIRPPETSAQARQTFYSQLPTQDFGSQFERIAVVDATSKGKPLTVLVDKSVTMEPYMKEIVSALSSAPSNIPISLVEVKDGFEYYSKEAHPNDSAFRNAISKFAQVKCEGGQSDASALDAIVRADASQGAILWVHAAQPVADSATPYLNAQLSSTRKTRLYDLQVASGPNVILNESYNFPALTRVVRSGSLEADLKTFLSNYSENKIRRCATTYGVRSSSASPEVKQIQAYRLALARYQAGDKFGAYELASRYHLVTPVSSAVVNMPNDEQLYEEKVAEYRARNPIGSRAVPEGFTLATPRREDQKAQSLDAFSMMKQKPADIAQEAKTADADDARSFAKVKAFNPMRAYPQSAPVLNGSTNGTIGPQAESAAEIADSAKRASEPMDGFGSYSAAGAAGAGGAPTSNFADRAGTAFSRMGDALSSQRQSSAGAAYPGGLVGAPVAPTYGQSNEVGQAADYESRAAYNGPRKSHGFLDATSVAILLPLIVLAFFVGLLTIVKTAKNKDDLDAANQLGNPFKD